MLHDPRLSSRGIVLTTIDLFFTLADFALALSDLEFPLNDVFDARGGPAWWSEGSLLDDFLDDGLGGG